MDAQQQAAMADATRLTREGRLTEATAVIRRSLGRLPAADAPTGSSPPGTTTSKHPSRAAAALTRVPSAADGYSGPSRGSLRRLIDRLPQRRRPTTAGPLRAAEQQAAAAGAGGQFVQRSFASQAGSRSYQLYVPTRDTGSGRPPDRHAARGDPERR